MTFKLVLSHYMIAAKAKTAHTPPALELRIIIFENKEMIEIGDTKSSIQGYNRDITGASTWHVKEDCLSSTNCKG